MDQQQQQLIDRIKQAQNVLVTVSVDPSVDQLAAAIGLTIALNKLDKHGTAVFSGQIPNTIEFLKPEETLESNTDSLRDFIIALDKSKADKLRYKVEDQVVRIFITPYKTSLSEKDLEFGQGDFNVDVVIALGVNDQKDIDAAIAAHGRILHDAAVASISVTGQGKLGSINWSNTDASSLSEMMLGLIDGLDKKLLDNQIATALLTGIVATTDRFRNEKTTPKTMSASAELMAAGADQKLIATELETPPPAPEPEPEKDLEAEHDVDLGTSPTIDLDVPEEPLPQETHEAEAPLLPENNNDTLEPPPTPGDQIIPSKPEPGELDIDHDEGGFGEQELAAPAPDADLVEEKPKLPEPEQPQIHVDEDGTLRPIDEQGLPEISQVKDDPDGPVDEPRKSGRRGDKQDTTGVFVTADDASDMNRDVYEPPVEELTLPPVNAPLLKHNENVLPPMPELEQEPVVSPFIPQAPLQPAPKDWHPPELPEPPKPPQSEQLPDLPDLPEPQRSMPPPSASMVPMSPLSLPPSPPVPPVPTLTPPTASVPPAGLPTADPLPPLTPPSPAPPLATPSPAPAAPPYPMGPTVSPMTPPVSSSINPPLIPPAPVPNGLAQTMPSPPASSSLIPNETLADIEQAVHSSHSQFGAPAAPTPANTLDTARNAVQAAYGSSPAQNSPLQPIAALNAMPLGAELHTPTAGQPVMPNPGFSEPTPGNTPADATLDMPLPSNPFGLGKQSVPPSPSPLLPNTLPGTLPNLGSQGNDKNPPPPVPPPMLPQL